MEKTLTINEVANILTVAPKTVRKYIKKGQLAGIKMPGGDWRMKPEHLDRWMEKRTVKARN